MSIISTPEKQLAPHSVRIATHEAKPYSRWTEQDESDVYKSLHQVLGRWKEDQYMIFGRQRAGDGAFNWEAVPYYKTSNVLSRIWQQFVILWRITFGGKAINETHKERVNAQPPVAVTKKVADAVKGNDAFCKKEVIESQLVFAGRTVNVLYNYAPIGFGGERLHFLVVPKAHKSAFTDLSEEEYVESMMLSQKLISHFSASRPIEDAYLFHKTGVDAGQAIPHWHQHVILTTSKRQDLLGKLTVLKNILFGSSPMKRDELAKRVNVLKRELNPNG